MNVGVLGLGYLGAVTAARVISDGHNVWRGDVGGPPEVDEIWAVAGRRRRAWPTQPHRGLVRSSRRSAPCMAESIRRFSLISAGKTLAVAKHPGLSGLSAGDYIDQTFARSRVIAATFQVIPSLPRTDIAVKVGVRRGAEVILVVATCPRPLSLRSPAPGRSRRVTRDQAGQLRLLSCAGSPSGSSGTAARHVSAYRLSPWPPAMSERVTGASADQLCQLHTAMAGGRSAMRVQAWDAFRSQ